MTSGLNSSASAMHELPDKPTLGSRFPLLRQSCVFRPPEETAACHTPSCAWIDNLISMCFSFFIWKKWKQSPFCGILAPSRLCSLGHRSTPNMLSVRMVMRLLHVVGFLLPNHPLPYLKKKITLKLDFTGPNDGSVPTSTDVLRPSSEDCGPIFISGTKRLPALHFPLLPRQVWFLEANFESLPCEYLKPSRAHSRTVWI